MYLGRPLCGKHWRKICEMPLDKARDCLKLPRPEVKEQPPTAGTALRSGPRLTEANTDPADPIQQMNIFGTESPDQGPLDTGRKKPRKVTTVKRKAATNSGDTSTVVQGDLFGDGIEEAS